MLSKGLDFILSIEENLNIFMATSFGWPVYLEILISHQLAISLSLTLSLSLSLSLSKHLFIFLYNYVTNFSLLFCYAKNKILLN